MTSNKSNHELPEPIDALYRIKRGLSGYVSYLAACEMNESFSEYVLYEPILRILTARGYSVECEVECPGVKHEKKGDRKRLDFVATRNGLAFALEVKWANRRSIDIKQDVLKLVAYRTASNSARAFLCVFGRQSILMNLRLKAENLEQQGQIVTADLGKTKYSCRIYEQKSPNKSQRVTR
jgi:Holliday junction resolvase